MPARKLSFHPAARDDVAGARQWYSQRSAIAARAFLTELILAVESVREAPERWPRYLAGTRQYHFPKFPFSLIYRVSDEAIVVIAIAHHRRKPGYWLERH